ncbi:MAG: flagellar hook-basal body complex protein, partial [Treponemataceae bacterium]|nr:flagellar hook-basal body complex protein [Treponemataceae bacterium]
MVRSLWTAATGMNGQQANLDTISHNLSNVNTTGYKQQRVEFEDLIYQNEKLAGTPATEDTVTPVGIQQGLGVRVGATQRIFGQGSLQATGVDTDVAIVGDGFFRVQQYDGSFAYTRDGSFKVDMTGQLVTN